MHVERVARWLGRPRARRGRPALRAAGARRRARAPPAAGGGRGALPAAQQLLGQARGLPHPQPPPRRRGGVCRDRPSGAAGGSRRLRGDVRRGEPRLGRRRLLGAELRHHGPRPRPGDGAHGRPARARAGARGGGAAAGGGDDRASAARRRRGARLLGADGGDGRRRGQDRGRGGLRRHPARPAASASRSRSRTAPPAPARAPSPRSSSASAPSPPATRRRRGGSARPSSAAAASRRGASARIRRSGRAGRRSERRGFCRGEAEYSASRGGRKRTENDDHARVLRGGSPSRHGGGGAGRGGGDPRPGHHRRPDRAQAGHGARGRAPRRLARGRARREARQRQRAGQAARADPLRPLLRPRRDRGGGPLRGLGARWCRTAGSSCERGRDAGPDRRRRHHRRDRAGAARRAAGGGRGRHEAAALVGTWKLGGTGGEGAVAGVESTPHPHRRRRGARPRRLQQLPRQLQPRRRDLPLRPDRRHPPRLPAAADAAGDALLRGAGGHPRGPRRGRRAPPPRRRRRHPPAPRA